MDAHPNRLSTLCGTVSDGNTGNPIFGVNVFLSNTTVGTVADNSGNYKIDNAPAGVYECVFQHIGYEIKTKKAVFTASDSIRMDMQLIPKVLQGEAVVVSAEYPEAFKKLYKEFVRRFLGTTKNTGECKILNPGAVQFGRDTITGIPMVFTDQALWVENRALGYSVGSYINAFKWSGDSIRYTMYLIFKTLTQFHEGESNAWIKNREKTYRGSMKHFLSAFARRRLDEEGFRMYRTDPEDGSRVTEEIRNRRIPAESLYALSATDSLYSRMINEYLKIRETAEDNRYPFMVFNIKDWIRVDYSNAINYLSFQGSKAKIDTLGNIRNPVLFHISGSWSLKGMADMLPLDYHSADQ